MPKAGVIVAAARSMVDVGDTKEVVGTAGSAMVSLGMGVEVSFGTQEEMMSDKASITAIQELLLFVI